MRLTITTDYAIRIVCFLAEHQQMTSTAELANELGVPVNYIPKITKQLKKANLISSLEGIKGGYVLAKSPENISLMDVMSCTESTMAINRCLERMDIALEIGLTIAEYIRFFWVCKIVITVNWNRLRSPILLEKIKKRTAVITILFLN